MIFKGHQKSSFIDYPDKICTVLFTSGCNFRCPYCHNSGLVKNQGEIIDNKYIFSYLNKRRNMLDAVCISGGEATLHGDRLYDFIVKVKEMGYLVKIDTNGTNPKLLSRLINDKLLDYIAMDIKAPIDKYNIVAGVDINTDNILESIGIIKNSLIDYEFRTTVCKELINKEDIIHISNNIKGSRRYVIQNFKDGDTVLAGKGRFTPYSKKELIEIEGIIEEWFNDFRLRL
jgi:pyruvate formate lyase activating enzyme